MRNKLKVLFATVLTLIMALSTAACSKDDGYDYSEIELPHYAYTSNVTSCNFDDDLFYRNEIAQKMGDPTTIMVEEGEWEGWLYSTGTTLGSTGFAAFRTKNFTEWESIGAIFTKADNHYGENSFWAPQLLWDETAKYEDYYVEQEEGEDGTGLYFLFYSSLSKSNLIFDIENKSTADDVQPSCYYPAMAVSKTPDGPFKEFTGINRNGLKMSAATPLFNIEYIDRSLDDNAEFGQELYKTRRSFIDACPFIAPDGTKYLYLARNRINDVTNEIWGMKMIDWATPDYSTVTRLTSFGYTTTERDEKFEYDYYMGRIDEGPFMVHSAIDGKYHLTFSVGGTSDKLYPVAQAIGDSPLGPFTKIQPMDGGMVCSPDLDWDMNSSGHHSFVEIGNELYIVYHTYPIDLASGTIGGRGQSFDKVEWIYNSKGQLVMHANGPTKTVQPLPEYYSGYKNVAPLATVTATNVATDSDVKYLNDGLIKMHDGEVSGWIDDQIKEFEAKGTTKITLTFDDYVTARAIMIYNSYLYENSFSAIKKISFSYRDAKGKTGVATIKNLAFDLEGNIVPLEVFFTEEELAEMTQQEKEENYMMRAGGASIAEFDELSINKIVIEVDKTHEKLCISDIFVLGKTA